MKKLLLILLLFPLITLAQNNIDANGNPVLDLRFPSSNLPDFSYNNSSTGSIPLVVEDSIPIYDGVTGLAYDGEFLWASGYDWYHIFKILPATGSIIDSIPISFSQAYGLTYDGNDLWVVERTSWPYQHKVHKIDTTSGNILQSFSSPSWNPNGLAWNGNLWHNDNSDGVYGMNYMNQTHSISASTGGTLQTYSNYGQPAGLAWDGQYLWCSHNGGIGIIQKYDISTFTIVDSIITPWMFPNDLAWDGSHLWVADNGHNMIFKIFVGNNGYGCTDPLACNYDSIATINDSSCVYFVIWQQSFSICDGDSVVVGSSVYDTTGNYIDTLTAGNGCDSIVYTNVSMPSIIWYQTYLICDGDSIVVGSSVYDTAGAYMDILSSANGCDSIVHTYLMVDQNTSSYDTLSVAASIVWNGMSLNVSGNYSVTLINSEGCDSIVNLNLTVTTTGISEITNTSNLLKITDILGRETKQINQPLFYIYDDGTVEKRIVIE